MIKVINTRYRSGNCVIADLIADTKSEVDNNGTIVGLPVGVDIDMGSTIITIDGHFAIYSSNGEWVWQGDDDVNTRSVQSSVSPQLNISRELTKGSATVDIDDNGEEPLTEEVTKR